MAAQELNYHIHISTKFSVFIHHKPVISWQRLSILVLVLAAALFVLFETVAEREYEEIPVFVIAGQSNAVGYGATWQELPADLHQSSDTVMFWYLQGNPQHPLASNGWVPLSGVEHHSLPVPGSELSIGPTAAAELRSRIAIIKVAFNGTALAQVEGMDWNVQSGNELLDQLINEVRRALSHMPKRTKGRLAGFFWMQGESDARSASEQPGMSLLYRQNLEALIEEVRLKFDKLDLPVVIARIAVPEVDTRGRHFAYRDTVREAQQAIAEADRYVALISTDDLPRQPDDLHFTAQGQWEMGKRFIAEWLQLTQDKR